MVFRSFSGALALLFFMFGCQSGPTSNPVNELFGNQKPDSVFIPEYAQGFSISYYNDVKLVHVSDPWDSTATGEYVLVGDESTPKKYRDSEIPFINFPVSRWAAFSSTQVVFAEKTGVLETLTSVAEPHYISNSFVQEQLKAGNIRDVGLSDAADVEVLLDSEPQFVFVSPFKDNRYGPLQEVGLLLINDCSYLENSPLGRAEWLVFFSTFFNKEEVAREAFSRIAARYYSIKEKVNEVDSRPTLLTGTIFNDIWYVPAGDSYMATLFKDAGTRYAYNDRPGTGSLTLDFETVFNDFRKSEYWVLTVNKEGRFTNDDLVRMDERYADFEAFKKGNVLFSNTSHSMFFERGIIEPDVVLKDLAASFHPGLYPEYESVYFEFLND